MSIKEFPSPHSIETIPGTEGWERMYPYYYQFAPDEPERAAYEKRMFWFYDGVHYPEPSYPFDVLFDESWNLGLSQYNTRIFSLPPVNGVDHRIINGYIYLTPVPVTDPNEVQARVGHFLERAGHYYQNWNELEAKWTEKVKGTIAELEAVVIPRLPDLEDITVVTKNVGESSAYHLLKAWDQLIDLEVRIIQYHFEFLNLGYAAYVAFMDFCQKLFPDIPVQRIGQMVSGIDVIMYRPDGELKNLARLAVKSGIDTVLASSPSFSTVKLALEKTQAGKDWLAALETARYPWFYISTGTGLSHHDRSWNDNLDLPLTSICSYAQKIRKGESIERPLEAVKKERERITAEYRDLIENDDDRASFDQLLGTARTVFPYVENHMFYIENWFHALFWNKVREVAAIFAEWGFFDAEDIWYLKRGEIKEALWDLTTAWATGVKPRGPQVWPEEIKWRKGVLQKFREWAPPPALGRVPEVIQEPFTVLLWGITNQSLEAWSKLQQSDDLSAVREFSGFAASPGTVEGKARVCRTVEEIGQLQDGEILVAPTTSPTWAPCFIKIKACVTDVGGAMSHAAIVCREYQMPAVVGTGLATKIIKTGQTIRVNGSTGEITIIQ